MLTDTKGLYLGIQRAAAEGEYHSCAWLVEFGLLAGRRVGQWLQSCGPLHKVLGEGPDSTAWLLLPVAW